MGIALAGVTQWIEQWPVNWKGCQFESQSGHMPGLKARSPGGDMWETTNQCISRTSVFLSLSLPSPLSKNKSIKYFFKNIWVLIKNGKVWMTKPKVILALLWCLDILLCVWFGYGVIWGHFILIVLRKWGWGVNNLNLCRIHFVLFLKLFILRH